MLSRNYYRFTTATLSALLLISLVPAAHGAPPAKNEVPPAPHCLKPTDKLDHQISHFDDLRELHQHVYAQMLDRLEKALRKLSDNGYETASLKADVTTLRTKTEKFKTDQAIFSQKMRETKVSRCSHSDGDFRNKLKEAQASLKVVHDDSASIRTFYRQKFKADLKTLTRSTKSSLGPPGTGTSNRSMQTLRP